MATAESPVRYFIRDGRASSEKIRAKIQARIGDLSAGLAAGHASDWADYRNRVGQITGLNEAHHMFLEIEKQER